MSASQDTATETSPLLSKSTAGVLFDTRPDPKGSSSDTTRQNGSVDHAEANESAVERQEDGKDRQRQYDGLPEVRERMKYMFPALGIGVFLAAADQTLVISSYTRIGSELDALNSTSWIAAAYFLTLTSFQPLFGKLSDIFNRKPCLLFCYTVFALGALGCGLAQDIYQLIIARAVAGVGGGGMTTIVSILFSDVIPLKERGTWQGYLNIVYACGAGFGAPLGGVFADGPGWRWSFLFQPPLCAIAIIAVGFSLKLPKREESDWKEKLRRVDFLGALVLVCAVFALTLGLDRGSNIAWRSKICLIPLCISFPLFAIFFFIEVKIAIEPFTPGRIFFDRSLIAAYLCNFWSFSSYMGTLFYLPLYFQAVQGHSNLEAGLLLLPSIIAGVSGSLFAGLYMQKRGTFYWMTVIAYTNLTLGLVLILLFSGLIIDTDIGICCGMAICGFSNGIGVTTTLISLISNAAREDQAVVTACSYLFRSLGLTTGVSLSSTVANSTLRETLNKQLGSGRRSEKIVAGVRKSLKYLETLKPETRQIVRHCYSLSTRGSFILQICLAAGAAVSAWFLREKPLSS